MTAPPLPSQEDKDRSHINVLIVLHYVNAGLTLFMIAFLFLHYYFMGTMFLNEELFKEAEGGAEMMEFFKVFRWFYLLMGITCLADMVVNILSAVFMRQKKFRMFSIVVAGLNCLYIPLGTALGVFTILVLLRPSVQTAYAQSKGMEESS